MAEIAASTTKKFGTFLGVYVPSVLTILGLIMYLRFGWVVGNVGLGWTFVIVILASAITFITGLSASAIATNIQVGVGGEYFLVSRSLGMETGGAIGIPLYFCRTLSVTFYCFGLAEAILFFWPVDWGHMPSYAIQLLAAFFYCFCHFTIRKKCLTDTKISNTHYDPRWSINFGLVCRGFDEQHT